MVTMETASPDGRFDVLAAACPTRQLVTRIGDRWTLLVLSALGEEPRRFTEVRRLVDGISQKMLTQTLRALERDGLVCRTAYPVVPPHVEYTLTPLGVDLGGVVASVRRWAYAHMDDIEQAREEFDQRPRPTVGT